MYNFNALYLPLTLNMKRGSVAEQLLPEDKDPASERRPSGLPKSTGVVVSTERGARLAELVPVLLSARVNIRATCRPGEDGTARIEAEVEKEKLIAALRSLGYYLLQETA